MAKRLDNRLFSYSRNRIIGTIMGLLALILFGTLVTIFLTTRYAVYKNNQKILEVFLEDYMNGEGPKGAPMVSPGIPEKRVEADSAVMYLVEFAPDGSVVSMLNDVKPLMSDEELTEFSLQLLSENKKSGISGRMLYRIEKDELSGSTYVVMMDNTLIDSSMKTLIANTVVFGLASLIILFFVSLKVSKEIMKPIEETYQKQRQFISDAGHELKTPISTVNANAELLQREIGQNRWLDNILFENTRMKELVTELLDLSKAENAKAVREDVDFSRIVTGGMLPFDSVAFEKGLFIEGEVAPDLHVTGDSKQLGQLVATLIDNAVSHTTVPSGKGSEQGKVSVRLFEKDGYAVLTVSNPGKEIPGEERDRIFERFYRTDDSRELNGHYGLGLAIAKAVVIAHGGEISVTCEGGITTFSARIPAARKAR